MKSWLRFWLAAVAVVLMSLTPKIVLAVLKHHAPPTTPPNDQLRRFLLTASAGPVEPVLAKDGGQNIVGWRFGSGGCVGQAFLSGLPGALDYEAQAHASNGARVLYIYRGAVSVRPPSSRLAADVIAFRLIWEFRPTRAEEPRYVVLVLPGGCARPPALPWAAFTVE